MNAAFKQFLSFSVEERIDIFALKAEDLDTLSTYVEKDFWVCLVLDILYNGLTDEHPRLLFKGGTSLSKAYQLINRFSEDVDITVFRQDLGFSGDNDPATPENISGKKRTRLSDSLKQVTSEYVSGQLRDDLESIAVEISSECSVILDANDEDNSTLLFQFPSLFHGESEAYVQPRIKLECGGRSAVDPHESCTIKPFIDELFEDINFSIHGIKTIKPERTFWDKVMILHGSYCRYRDERFVPQDRNRLSRHYYDVAMIFKTEIGKNTVSDNALREDVRNHTMRLFKRKWMKLEEAIPGTLHLVPEGELLTTLKADYQYMQMMMLGEAPDFDSLITEITELEKQINRLR